MPLPNQSLNRLDQAEAHADAEIKHQSSKKELILEMFQHGQRDLAEIVCATGASPSYAAAVLTEAGLLSGYFDLYTTTNQPHNLYGKFFRGVLSFKSVEAAQESVERIDRLFHYFERLGDRAGQHHAQVMALIGRNRARWSGKHDEALIFTQWLNTH